MQEDHHLRHLIKLLIKEEQLASKLGAKNKTVRINPNSPVAQEVKDDVFDMIQKSYTGVGGHLKIKSPDDIGKEYSVWDLEDVDDDPEPDVVRLSNPSPTSGGLKGGVVASDGSSAGKEALINMLVRFYKQPGNWSEVSGPVAKILVRQGLKPVEDEARVKKLLAGKEVQWVGKHPEGFMPKTSGWYKRTIAGHDAYKMIIGNV